MYTHQMHACRLSLHNHAYIDIIEKLKKDEESAEADLSIHRKVRAYSHIYIHIHT